MRNCNSLLTLVFVAVGAALAESAKTVTPGQHVKGMHGASTYEPGHVNKCKVRAGIARPRKIAKKEYTLDIKMKRDAAGCPRSRHLFL